MASIQKFEDIKAWQKARVLTKEIYVITKSKSFDNDFDLIRQIRRATVSVMANIAEGFERKRNGVGNNTRDTKRLQGRDSP